MRKLLIVVSSATFIGVILYPIGEAGHPILYWVSSTALAALEVMLM